MKYSLITQMLASAVFAADRMERKAGSTCGVTVAIDNHGAA